MSKELLAKIYEGKASGFSTSELAGCKVLRDQGMISCKESQLDNPDRAAMPEIVEARLTEKGMIELFDEQKYVFLSKDEIKHFLAKIKSRRTKEIDKKVIDYLTLLGLVDNIYVSVIGGKVSVGLSVSSSGENYLALQ